MIRAVGSCCSGSARGAYGDACNRSAGGTIADSSADASRAGGRLRVVKSQRELVRSIGLKLVEERRVGLHGDAVRRRMKRYDPQPAIAAVGDRLEVGEDLVYEIAVVADVSPMRAVPGGKVAVQHHNHVCVLAESSPH